MKKRVFSLILTVLLVLPVMISAGSIVFAPENGFLLFDEARLQALSDALSAGELRENEGYEHIGGENRYIVQFSQSASLSEIETALENTTYSLLAESECRLFTVSVEDSEFLDRHSDIIEYYEPDMMRESFATTNDPATIHAYEPLEIYTAWDMATAKSSIIVAVLDTGVDRSHEDLSGANILAGYDAVARKSGVYEDSAGHGTGVIGLIAATANNNIGIAGVAHGVTILPVKVSSGSTAIYSSDLIRGIRFAADAGAKIINMSIGGYSSSYAEQAAVDYAVSKGCILISAAGNGGNSSYGNQKSYPASYEGVISVASCNSNGERSDFSQYNEFVDIAAPGESIPMPFVDADGSSVYRTDSGTSFSCAFVSGIAALAASYIGDEVRFGSAEFEALLIDACGVSRNNHVGYGMIDASEVLRLARLPIITGVSDGGKYAESIKIGFNRGTATLDGEPFEDGETVITNGSHKLTLTYGETEKTISFRLNYDPLSYEYLEFVSFAYFEFNRGTALLDGFPYASGERITAAGRHSFVLTDGEERTEKEINLRYSLPTVYGVSDSETYDRPIEISVVGDGKAMLDGERIVGNVTVAESGSHVIELTSGSGVITDEILFRIEYDAAFKDIDLANAKAAVDEENGYICLYADSLVGVRINDINDPEKYLHFLPTGRVHSHIFTETELILFGDRGITRINRATALQGEAAITSVLDIPNVDYYIPADGAIASFSDSALYIYDEASERNLWYTDLDFDCENAFYRNGNFYMLSPSNDNIVRVFNANSFSMVEYDLGYPLEDARIVFGDGYLAVDNRLFDALTGRLLLEFNSNYAVKIEGGRLYASNHIIDISTGKELGVFPFRISDIVFGENANYLFGSEMIMCSVPTGKDGIAAYGAAERAENVISATDKMNFYHTNAFYSESTEILSADSAGNTVYLVTSGRNSIYSYDIETLSENEPVPMKFKPSRVYCSGGYILVGFENTAQMYIANLSNISGGFYVELPARCRSATVLNGIVYAASGNTLHRINISANSTVNTEITAQAVVSGGNRLFVLGNNLLTVYDENLTPLRVRVMANAGMTYGGYIAVGKTVYNPDTLMPVCTTDADILAMKGDLAITKKGMFDIENGEYVGGTATESPVASVICVNNAAVTFGEGEMSVCSYGDGSELLDIPEISGIENGGVYIDSVTIHYENGIGYLDGSLITPGESAIGVGDHVFILSLPCGRSIKTEFSIAAQISKIEFMAAKKTISVGEKINLSVRYLPEGASSVPAKFSCDKTGLEITESGEVIAHEIGEYTVKASVDTENGVLEATCIITVRDDLIAVNPESGIRIDRNSGLIMNILPGTTAESLISMLSVERDAAVLNADGKKIKGTVSTGDRLVLYGEDGISDELTIAVCGDIDGDGCISAYDLYCLGRMLRGAKYDDEFTAAADVNGNGVTADNDYRALSRILLGRTDSPVGTPEPHYFGSFSVETVTHIESEQLLDVAIVLSGCKYARGVYGAIELSPGLELVECDAGEWDSDYYVSDGTLHFYAYSTDGKECNTAYKVLLNLRFRVTAERGSAFALSCAGLNVSFKDGCKTVGFVNSEHRVDDNAYGEFDVLFNNAESFEFDPVTHDYTATIPHNSAIADIKVIRSENQTVSVSSLVVPDSGETTVVISISDENGNTEYYNIIVRRGDAPEIETNCKLSDLEVEGLKLNPSFSPDFYEYSISVPFDTEKINIYAVAQSDSAEIVIGDTALTGEETVIPITVGAPDGETLVYTITVKKLPEPVVNDESSEASSEASSEPIEKENDGFPTWAIVIIALAVCAGIAGVVIYTKQNKK